jgi:SAM-dependent methyltransferase
MHHDDPVSCQFQRDAVLVVDEGLFLAPSYQTISAMMSGNTATNIPGETRLQRLSSALLASMNSARPRGRTLELKHPSLEIPETGSPAPALTISITVGKSGSPGHLACRSESLPFQHDSFDHVLLHHVFSDGVEPELEEACRVLRPGGHLLIMGLNRWGLRYQAGHRFDDIPGLRVLRLCRALRERKFLLETCAGSGLAGLPWPGPWRQGWQGMPLPLADLVLIVARRNEERPVTTPLRFTRPQVAGARAAALEGFNRQAAA